MDNVYRLEVTYNYNDEGTYTVAIGVYSTYAKAKLAKANFIAEELEGGLEGNPHVRVGFWACVLDANYLEAQADDDIS